MGYDQGLVKIKRLEVLVYRMGFVAAFVPVCFGQAVAADKAKPKSVIKDVAKAPTPLPIKDVPKEKKARVYTFTGLDVEGKLKTPQLLYFRSRVKQELDTSTSEKRSFLKELEATTDDKGL